MPRISISKENFQEIDIYTRKYNVRYRIIAENQNSLSTWSPIFEVDPGFNFVTSNDVSVERTVNQTLVAWDTVQIEKNGNNIGSLQNFDVWIRFGLSEAAGNWEYYQRVSESSVNIAKPVSITAINYFSIEIYRPMRPRDYRIVLYEIDQSNAGGRIDLIKDQITFPTNDIQTGDGLRFTSVDPILGLIDNTTYYARKESSTIVTLHPTKTDAQNNTNKINLDSHENHLGYFKWEESLVYDFLLYSAYNIPSA